MGDLEHSIACEQPWFQRRIIGTCSTKRVTYSNHITLPREPLNWGRRTLSLDLSAAQAFATISYRCLKSWWLVGHGFRNFYLHLAVLPDQGIKPLEKLRNILCCSFSIHYDHKAYSQMRQLKEKHATKYASLHNSLLYRKRRDVTVENYEGPLIVWAGVIGTEGLPWVILAVSRHHEPGVPRACVGHRLMSKAHTVTKPWYDFFDFYYVGLLQSRSATKLTCPLPYLLLWGYRPLQTRWMRVNRGSQVENLVFIKESLTRIVQSANMHIRHLLACLTA